ncbi:MULTISPECIES: DUF4843 domain-containing protein [unclassified Butyricimonas]|uniref:DUF4843 domain-containing protein n=1 Tax=unclassified Butyricimonas TaxID=2637652 RepID=UPI000C06EF20|nr:MULTISPECIES: DUF4843 domain-containing protein [unclassified Butyricimonas]
MKNLTTVFQLLVLFVFLQSCEEYKMVQYDEGERINFMGDYYRGKNEKPHWGDDKDYLNYENNFGINPLGDSLLMDTVQIGVKISGPITDYPRKVVFTTRGTGKNALEVIFPEEYYVPADTGIAVFQIWLKRPATRNVEYSVDLTFDYEKSDFKAGTVERQVFNLKVEDSVSLELWGSDEKEWNDYYSLFFGAYSETKVRYLITKYGETDLKKWNYSAILNSNGFYRDFEAYKANPANKPLIDENTGEWIEIPDYRN